MRRASAGAEGEGSESHTGQPDEGRASGPHPVAVADERLAVDTAGDRGQVFAASPGRRPASFVDKLTLVVLIESSPFGQGRRCANEQDCGGGFWRILGGRL